MTDQIVCEEGTSNEDVRGAVSAICGERPRVEENRPLKSTELTGSRCVCGGEHRSAWWDCCSVR